ncbi:MAG TPA: hypothetical protein VF520_14750 [Thermoleophilaceae bacterium]|jgi:hypothetical protein
MRNRFARLCALACALVVCAVVAPGAEGRTDNREKPVYFVHGYANGSDVDCDKKWNDMMWMFRAWGQSGTLRDTGYYHHDTNCGYALNHHGSHSTHYGNGHADGSHTEDTRIEHLAYHLAWDIYDHYSRNGTYVDVVAHSMGGLIIRYAIAQVERHHPDFPPSIRVEDVVTLGTPHGGARFAALCAVNCNTQVQQMKAGSGLLGWLEENAWEPDGYGGTDWTTVGSGEDNQVAADRAVGSDSDRDPIHKYIGSGHKAWYTDANGIEHDDYLHDIQDTRDADVHLYSTGGPGWVFSTSGAWPVRRADLAVTFGNY